MRCCSCRRYELTSLRLAALRQSAARCAGCSDALELDVSAPASAFVVYCSCTKQRSIPITSTHLGAAVSSAADAAHLMFIRWRHWSLMFRQQFLRDLENSVRINYRYLHHHQQQKRQRELMIRKPSRGVFGKLAGISTTSARQFSCPSCSYSTDRKNNLKRHVTTMHQRLGYAAVTSSGGNHDDGETQRRSSSFKRAPSPITLPVTGVV